MGDASPIRTLGDYSKPSHEGYRNTIELLVRNNVVPLRSNTIRLVQNGCSFHGLRSEDPNQHLKDFLKLVDSLNLNDENRERMRCVYFNFLFAIKLETGLNVFQQDPSPRESLSEAWTRFKDLLQNVPHHGIELWLQVQIFYDHVNPVTRRTIDQSASGKLRDRNAEESWALLEDPALYDNENVLSTSDRLLIEIENQVQRLMEAHLASTQPTQVNKITTSCEICSGPHDTQYCMEDLEQAFVEYASSCTDEAGDAPLLEQKDITVVDNLGSNKHDEGIEWLDVEEPLDLVDTSEESIYESLIKEIPKCSLNYDFKIKKGDPKNLKIPCMIGHKFTAIAYIDVDLTMNIMSLAYYNSIRKNGYEYRGRNFVGLGRDMRILVGNVSYVIDFTILENIETNIDPSLSHVIFGRPFIEIACLAINRKLGLMTFTDETKEITFKTSYKDPQRSEFSSKGNDLLSSRVILSEDDYDRGCRKPSDLEEGFYRDTIKLGPEYVTGMDDDGEVTLYLTRRSLKVLRKSDWIILGGRFNQLSHVSSPLLSKPGEYFLALGCLLEEIHVTCAHLEKKWTRLRFYTKSLNKLCIQSVETASRVSSDGVRTFEETTSKIW
ncbi:hypothetical protein Tco_1132396 [Tanacetum coccineum]|uniref:MAK10-like protein n=1 Tax=Tanacetum coccineum TaxID=301880 RepID=A0ABQ5JD72_9ASTR